MAKFFLIVFLAVYIKEISGHGYMIDPPNRASLWRFDWTKTPNYEDNQFFCGGVEQQYGLNGGKCGVCGDNYSDPRPRSNENTGLYGDGTILRTYQAGQIINVSSIITANHLGNLFYSLCVLEDRNQPEPEDCFVDLKLADNSDSRLLLSTDYSVVDQVKLPEGVTCEQCVFRWHYRTGNSWGTCEDGLERVGCGDQEIFRSCADITIV